MSDHDEPSSEDDQTSPPPKTKFERGDHVYQWCSIAGVPRVFQHHGIVMHVTILPGEKEGETIEQLTIADFSNFLPETIASSTDSTASSKTDTPITEDDPIASPPRKLAKFQSKNNSSSLSSGASSGDIFMGQSTGGILRVYTTTTTNTDEKWHKVEYGVPRWKTLVSRSGISTTVAASDSPEMVLHRVNFLLVQAERQANDTFRSAVLPKYHLLFANCECVATWCKTGKWTTLQGASFMAWSGGGGTTMATLGQAAVVATAATPTAIATEATAAAVITEGTVAAMFLGTSTTASQSAWVIPTATSAWIIPAAMAAYGASWYGTLLLARAKWDKTTQRLNEACNEELARATPLSLM